MAKGATKPARRKAAQAKPEPRAVLEARDRHNERLLDEMHQDIDQLREEVVRLREHLAVQLSHNRRLIEDKGYLQGVVQRLRQQVIELQWANQVRHQGDERGERVVVAPAIQGG